MSTSRAARPQIKPGLRRVWRDAATIQIGLTPDLGVIVTGLEPGEAALVEQLDGTHRLSDLKTWAAAHGLEPARVAAAARPAGRRRRAHRAADRPGPPAPARRRQRLRRHRPWRPVGPDALAWSVVYPDGGDGFELLAQRRRQRVLVVGRGRLASAVHDAVRRTGARLCVRPDLTDHNDIADPGSRRTGWSCSSARTPSGPAPGRSCSARRTPTWRSSAAPTGPASARWSCPAARPVCAASSCIAPTATRPGRPSRPSSGCHRRRRGASRA